MTPFLLAAVGGILMWAAFPPLDIGVLAFVAPAPLLWAARRVETIQAAAGVGMVFGLAFFGSMLWWISVLGFVAWLPLVLVQAGFMATYAVVAWAFRQWPAGRWWLIVIAAWGIWEFIRARFPLGGFPWGSLGSAAAGSPGFIGAVQWIAPAGWGILAVAVAAGLVLVIEDTVHWHLLVDPFVVALLLAMAGGLFPPSADGASVNVAVVQGGSPCPMVHCADENRLIYESHLALTQELVPGTVDLVIWPENSLGTPFDLENNTDVRASLEVEARRLDANLLISGTETVDADTFINANSFFGKNGSKLGEYLKRHPVPFGEFVPLRSVFGFIPQLDRVPRDMVRGDEAVVFPTDQGIIGSVISYEGAFTRYFRDEAQAGAQLMVVATNESSYGVGHASDQLIDLARVNAAAVGQDLVVGAITGRSAYIDADGTVVATTELLEARNFTGTVNYRIGAPTIYTRFGDWLLIVAVTLAALALVLPGGGSEKAP